MAKPSPWSHTALSDFVNCPYAYHQKYVLKTVKTEATPEMLWGRRVHKDFELRIAEGKALPLDLKEHEPFLAAIEALPGVLNTERDIALTTSLEDCGKWDKNVFYRGVIDVSVIDNDRAMIGDYKTGKVKPDPTQLIGFTLHTFHKYPFVNRVLAFYYWTVNGTTSDFTYRRSQVPELWDHFVPNLKQYREAYRTDVWQKRPSGLCHGWCPQTLCEHWRPRRR